MTNGVICKRKTNNNTRLEVKTISILDELYYDNISIQNLNFQKSTEYKKQMITLSETEKYLSQHLKGRFKSEFKDFDSAWNYINNETNRMYFVEGFKLGAQIICETFYESNKHN